MLYTLDGADGQSPLTDGLAMLCYATLCVLCFNTYHNCLILQCCCSMDAMESLAQRNAMLVHGLDWNERRAGIFEPAPADDLAVATTLGLVLNCLSSGLYMVMACTHAVHALLPDLVLRLHQAFMSPLPPYPLSSCMLRASHIVGSHKLLLQVAALDLASCGVQAYCCRTHTDMT